MQKFNEEMLNTMKEKVNTIKSIYEVCEYCKEGNRIANEEYLKKYPTHKDLLSIFEQAVSILELNIINECNEYIVENVLNDIEFIIGQNVLMESHIQRLLLSPVTLQNFPIFKKKSGAFKDRVMELYNCNSNKFYYKYNVSKATTPFNYQQLESYMRYNKIGYEEELINNEINGDYVKESFSFDFSEEIMKSTDEKVKEKYACIENINIIDKFKLEQHGFNPIVQCDKQFVHYKNGKQYNLYKQGNYYYMINESLKSYKITVKENPININLESLFNINGRK